MKVTLTYVALCVVVFGITTLFPETHALLKLQQDVLYTEPWRLLTAAVTHNSLGHVAFNCVSLLLFGLVCEAKLGSRRVFWFVIISALVSNAFAGNYYISAAGASGVVYALIGLATVLMPFALVPAFGVPMPLLVAGVFYFVASIGGLFVESNTGHIAHLSGLVVGVLYGFRVRPMQLKRDRRPIISDAELQSWENRYLK